jgi:hypothetical protein
VSLMDIAVTRLRGLGLRPPPHFLDGILRALQAMPWIDVQNVSDCCPPLGLLLVCLDAVREGRLGDTPFSATDIFQNVILQALCTCGKYAGQSGLQALRCLKRRGRSFHLY